MLKKDWSQRRVILDRRRWNIVENSLPRALLELLAAGQLGDGEYLELVRLMMSPHTSQSTGLAVGPEQRLFASSEDVAEFYHSLLWPVARWSENADGPLLRPSELLAFARDGPRRSHLLRLLG